MTDKTAPTDLPPSAMTDATGKPSAIRWLSLLFAVIAGLLAANHAALMWADQEGDLMLVLYFLIASAGGKVGQKALEAKTR